MKFSFLNNSRQPRTNTAPSSEFPLGHQQSQQYHSPSVRAIFESNNFEKLPRSVLCGKISSGKIFNIHKHASSVDEKRLLSKQQSTSSSEKLFSSQKRMCYASLLKLATSLNAGVFTSNVLCKHSHRITVPRHHHHHHQSEESTLAGVKWGSFDLQTQRVPPPPENSP